MTRITFIMPTFNRADFIAESIDSILSQIGRHDELIVVDDGSTDLTAEAVGPYLDTIRYLKQENAGKSAALNRALGETDSEYVWICDDDDLLNSGVVESLVAQIQSSGADVVFGHYSRFREVEGHREDLGTGYWPDLSQGSPSRHLLEDAFVMHNAAIVRRGAYASLGHFDESMLRSQDYEMFVRLALTHQVTFTDRQIFLQRKHSGDRGPAKISHSADASDEIWEKYDRKIFGRLRDLVPQEFFTSMFDSENPDLAERAGLLQRACILARHGLWHDALIDCVVAGGRAPECPLHPLEVAICRRFTAGKHGFSGLLDRKNAQAFNELPRAGHHGPEIAAEISRGLFWRIKSGEISTCKQALQHLIRKETMKALIGRKFNKRKSLPNCRLLEQVPNLQIGRAAMKSWLSRAET